MFSFVLRNVNSVKLRVGILPSLRNARTSFFACSSPSRSSGESGGSSQGGSPVWWARIGAVTAVISSAVWWNLGRREGTVQAAARADPLEDSGAGERRANLPDYTLEQIAEHDSIERRVWLTYGQGVYDVTEFVRQHPGGKSIMMAAGGAADPFWSLYGVHKKPHVLKLLERYRVGNVAPSDVEQTTNSSSETDDLWADEPRRHPALRVSSNNPFNGEPPVALLDRSFHTPVDLFYVRNHLPVPNIDADTFRLEIDCSGVEDDDGNSHLQREWSLEQLRDKFTEVSVDAAVMCAGNRRSEMSAVKPVRGLSWHQGAVGNARWTGVRLRDVILHMLGDDVHVTSEGHLSGSLSHIRHVCFDGADTDAGGQPYGASVPLETALNPTSDILLVYSMNDQPLTRDHGYPLRVLTPGIVGARSVKWVSRIYLSTEESTSHWQRRDYKGFCPSVDWDTVDFDRAPAIQQLPVISAFCWPNAGSTVKVSPDRRIKCSGYAWSGGGRRVVRVDVSGDGGQSWHEAKLLPAHTDATPSVTGRCWAWTLWTAEVVVPDHVTSTQLCVKAVDDSYNTQPESFENIWNLRGVLANAYHRVNIDLDAKTEQ